MFWKAFALGILVGGNLGFLAASLFITGNGIGWYVRKNDLKRMVGAYDEVFTFHKEELNRFKELLSTVFNK